jgi:hypothetical protein
MLNRREFIWCNGGYIGVGYRQEIAKSKPFEAKQRERVRNKEREEERGREREREREQKWEDRKDNAPDPHNNQTATWLAASGWLSPNCAL